MSACDELGTAFSQALICLILTTILWGGDLNTEDSIIKSDPQQSQILPCIKLY